MGRIVSCLQNLNFFFLYSRSWRRTQHQIISKIVNIIQYSITLFASFLLRVSMMASLKLMWNNQGGILTVSFISANTNILNLVKREVKVLCTNILNLVKREVKMLCTNILNLVKREVKMLCTNILNLVKREVKMFCTNKLNPVKREVKMS